MTTRHVTFESHGSSGTVTYHEAGNRLACHWEFGGGGAVAIVQCGSDWTSHPWAHARRPEILQFIANEVVRQKAPSCRAEIDLRSGDIVLRQIGKPAGPAPGVERAAASAWYFRLSALRAKLALFVLAVSLLVGSAVWAMNALFAIKPGKGTPIGLTVRTDRHLATLIRTLDAYIPSLHRDHGKDTYSISLFLVPLDGSATHLIRLRSGLSGGAFSLARILGSDGRTLWFNVVGIGGIDLASYRLRPAAETSSVDPRTLPTPWGDSPFQPKPEHYLAAGLMTSPTTWLGLHSEAEVASSYRPQQWIRPVVNAENAKQMRRFHVGQIAFDDAGYHRIASMQAVDATEFLNAAFLRPGNTATPIRMADPAGALMLYTAAPGLNQTAILSRVDDNGTVQWRTDLGIDRFRLQQILPGESTTAFVGTRPPVPDTVSEPLLVIIDHRGGRQIIHSLWP